MMFPASVVGSLPRPPEVLKLLDEPYSPAMDKAIGGAIAMQEKAGLDVITEKTVDNLHVATVGNPSMHIPTMLGGLPGMEGMATMMMKKELDRLDIPPVREMLQVLSDSGAKIYGCRMAMDMFKRTKDDLVPQVDEVISAMDFFDKAAGAQVIFI